MVMESSQAVEMCKIYKDILSVSMDAYGSVISNNANDTMKKLTVITILLAIPTMIAGFWGMNMPVPWQAQEGDTSTLWFWVVIGATFVLTAVVAFILVKSMKFRPATKRRQKKQRRTRK